MTAPIPFDPDDDDRLIGRVLSRREVLALFGASGIAVAVAACAPSGAASAGAGATAGATAAGQSSAVAVASGLPTCVVVPELTEGPYYVDENLDRTDIRVDTTTGSPVEGTTLRLDWAVSMVDGGACVPLEGVLVDVWHCDAEGVYSDVAGAEGHDFLRGYQRTDADGRATITTIYPGWYSGRAVHIHFKVRTEPEAASGFEFTSQLFFDEAVNEAVFAQGIYASKGSADVPNDADGIFQQSQGMTLLTPTADGDGYAATFEIGINAA
jgi:protocatechuate 3,4-dioxygenase beta subunit